MVFIIITKKHYNLLMVRNEMEYFGISELRIKESISIN